MLENLLRHCLKELIANVYMYRAKNETVIYWQGIAWRSFFLQVINESLNVSTLMPVVCSGAGTLIARYDEHALVSRFKFGVLHQRAGQVTEEQLFGNRQITPAFQEFLDLLGQKIDLKDHKGLVFNCDRIFLKLIFNLTWSSRLNSWFYFTSSRNILSWNITTYDQAWLIH